MEQVGYGYYNFNYPLNFQKLKALHQLHLQQLQQGISPAIDQTNQETPLQESHQQESFPQEISPQDTFSFSLPFLSAQSAIKNTFMGMGGGAPNISKNKYGQDKLSVKNNNYNTDDTNYSVNPQDSPSIYGSSDKDASLSNFNPSQTLFNAKDKLKADTGITLSNPEGLLTNEEEMKVVNHLQNTFGKNGIKFPPDTVVKILSDIERPKTSVGVQKSGLNEVRILYRKDKNGNALLDDPSLGMLEVMTHELGHQDDDASRSLLGDERKTGGNETEILNAAEQEYNRALKSSDYYQSYLEARENGMENASQVYAALSVTDTLKNAPKALRDNISNLTRKMARGELTALEYMDEVETMAIRFPVYGRMTDSKGNDLYNRVMNQIENGKDMESNYSSLHEFREKFDPISGKTPKHSHGEAAKSTEKYGATDAQEFYGDSMENYVHHGQDFRGQIAQDKQKAAYLASMRDKYSKSSQEWQELNMLAKYAEESADILLETYNFMKKRFNGKEF